MTFGHGLTTLPGSTFLDADKLESVCIPNTITKINNRAFRGASALKKIQFEEGSTLNSIEDLAFSGATSLEGVVLPDSVKTIGNSVFDECSNLSAIKLNEGLKKIGSQVFNGCVALTDIEIPSTVTSIAYQKKGFYSVTLANSKYLVPYDTWSGIAIRPIEGAEIVGWYGVDGKYHDYQGTSITSKTKVYGVYSVQTSLDANGGSGNASKLTTYFAPGFAENAAIEKLSNKSCKLPTDAFKREGYILIGWTTRTDGTGMNYTVGSELPIGKNHIETLYAQWGKKVDDTDVYSVASSIPDQTYDSTEKKPTVTVYKNGVKITSGYEVEYKDNINAGTATATVKVGDVEIGTANFKIKKATPTITISPSVPAQRGAGTVTLTVTKPEKATGTVTVKCDNGITVDPEDGVYTAVLPNATRTYTFTASYAGDNNYNAAEDATCTVDVTRKKSSSSSSDTSAPTYGVSTGKTENGEISVTPAKAEAGETVTIKVTPDSGYQLDKMTVKDKNNSTVKLKKVDDNEYTFTMPVGKVSVDATFVQKDAADDSNAAEAGKTIKLQIGSRIVNVDNEAVIYDAAPVIRNDRTLVPIRIITEALGGKVDWNGATKEVTLSINDKEIKMTIGKTLEKYGVAPVIIDGRTFVPVRFVADELGAEVAWDEATKTVTIKTAR